jgi:hypothetical protein
MTVKVTVPDNGTDAYMRFGDAFIKHHDGTSDIIRNGAKQPFSYASGEWTDVEGDPERFKKRFRA